MATKKRASKGEGRSKSSAAGKGEAKQAPVETSRASAEEGSRETKAAEKAKTAPASQRTRGTAAEKPRARQGAAAKAATGGARRREDPVSAVLSEASPSRDQIAQRAYELFAKSGYQHGHADEHWLQAERELQRESAARRRPPPKPRSSFSSV